MLVVVWRWLFLLCLLLVVAVVNWLMCGGCCCLVCRVLGFVGVLVAGCCDCC